MTARDADHVVTTISTTPQQALSGTAVGTGSFAQCASCQCSIGEGSTVALRAHRFTDETRWTTAAIHCSRCLPDHGTITTPTTGAAEIVVAGRLTLRGDAATQSHRLVFTADEGPAAVLDYSGPDDGH
ncbi:hypothetical protein C448_09662 [Halococcus morrhuae DSM 1307]|uniref:DUF8112 domain-containing protein n=1 Tax=Halococcus morrhuae DSM 1307 TaxID=931277 RepID=M0MDX2_HALMO|nr:hypothetical protein [Halococcus morrhuae]EMA43503.1 hypothetical protein C448_09662 [Halococcus morrhuae DSM 1307]